MNVVNGSDLTVRTFIATFGMIPIVAFPAIDDRLGGYFILVITPTIETHVIPDEFLDSILFINQVIRRL